MIWCNGGLGFGAAGQLDGLLINHEAMNCPCWFSTPKTSMRMSQMLHGNGTTNNGTKDLPPLEYVSSGINDTIYICLQGRMARSMIPGPKPHLCLVWSPEKRSNIPQSATVAQALLLENYSQAALQASLHVTRTKQWLVVALIRSGAVCGQRGRRKLSQENRVDATGNFASGGLRPDCWSSLDMEVVSYLAVAGKDTRWSLWAVDCGSVLFRRLEVGIGKSRL